MDDGGIIELFFARDERALRETEEKYGAYCRRIAENILGNEEGAECVNDAYFSLWNSIPPNRPSRLGAYVGRITRNIAFNRYKSEHRQKRGGYETAAVLDELEQCVSGTDSVEGQTDRRELSRAIGDFLKGLPEKKRRAFVLRYWHSETVERTAAAVGMAPNTTAKMLERVRKELKRYLTERGFEL